MRSSPNRLVAIIFGAVYLVVGALGFLVTAGVDFIATDGGLLLGIFEVNPLHNIVHLLIGAALLIAGLSSVSAAKATNIVVGAVYLLVGIVGFFLVGTALNILALTDDEKAEMRAADPRTREILERTEHLTEEQLWTLSGYRLERG